MTQGAPLFPISLTEAPQTTVSSAARASQPSLFPAYSAPPAEPPNAAAAEVPSWLCNPSYDPAVVLPEREPEEEEEEEQETFTVVEEVVLDAPRKRKKAKEQPVQTQQAATPIVRRKFRFLLGPWGEDRFFIDPVPDRSNLAMNGLPPTQLAVYPKGWRCDLLPRERVARKKVVRFWQASKTCASGVARASVPFAAGQEYVPLEGGQASRNPAATGKCVVDPLGVMDAATRNYIQGKGKEEKEEEEVLSQLCPEALARHAELQERLRLVPGDEQAWLDLVAFQEEYVAALEEASGIHRTHGRARAIRDKKLAVLEQALLRTHGCVSLHLLKIQVLLELGEEARASQAWEELLRLQPGNWRLWLERARFLQAETTLSGFEVAAAGHAYLRALACFRDMQEGRRSSSLAPEDIERHLVEVCRQYAVFLCQCGQWERAVGLLQALLELSLRRPPRVESLPLDQWLTLLEPFWDSGAPRFGESDSQGWAHLMEQPERLLAQQSSKDDEAVSEPTVGEGQDLREAWLSLECHRERHHWLPYRPDLSSGDEGCDDPERMVMLEDLTSALFRLRLPASQMHLLRATVDVLLGGGGGADSSLVEADCFQRLPGVDLTMARRFRDSLGFPSGWSQRAGTTDFVHRLLAQSQELFSKEPLLWDEHSLLWMKVFRRADDWTARQRKKAAKALLSEPRRERHLDLWTEYGQLLLDMDLSQEAATLYERALDTVWQPEVLSECRGDRWRLLSAYLDLCLGEHGTSTTRERALLVLSCAGGSLRISEALKGPLRPSALVRAVATLDVQVADPECSSGALRAALWGKALTAGFKAAAALARQWLERARDNAKGLEEAHEAYVRLCTHEVSQGGSQRALRAALHQALQEVPRSASLLWHWASLQAGALGALSTRRLLDGLVQKQHCPLAWLVALCFELARAQQLDTHRAAGASFTLPHLCNHLRRVLERALESVSHRRCPLLWRLYVHLETLYMDGVHHFPECLQEVADMLLEKGIRLRAPLEEVQLLLDHPDEAPPS
ncbi:nuclear exosome regulator NRDE2 isoform X2 [Ixodes scapularis]|uniref:nuclear exosome regulator NRDE2 isoform X2 n=1 Tax=Ixodes scapularis TaxID=6945 RepID=UPI001A9CBA9D|nr:nuclear exosome regulator NRDE2 isoform X2 [Ixodes scapularis]